MIAIKCRYLRHSSATRLVTRSRVVLYRRSDILAARCGQKVLLQRLNRGNYAEALWSHRYLLRPSLEI